MNRNDLDVQLKQLLKQIQTKFGVAIQFAVGDEPLAMSELSTREKKKLTQFTSPRRQKSWLLGRNALKHLLRTLGENDDTHDLVFPNSRVSLTHTENFAVAIGTPSSAFHGIGVDLEMTRMIKEHSLRIFLTPEESTWIKDLDRVEQTKTKIQLWTIKEALYKSTPQNNSLLLNHFNLGTTLNQSGGTASTSRNTHHYDYFSSPLENGFISVAVCQTYKPFTLTV